MRTMKELWTAQVELLTPPSEDGDTKCFTNIVAMADNAVDFQTKVLRILEKDSWSLRTMMSQKNSRSK
jgi:hypothetical protein